jgi:hypothetical protein
LDLLVLLGSSGIFWYYFVLHQFVEFGSTTLKEHRGTAMQMRGGRLGSSPLIAIVNEILVEVNPNTKPKMIDELPNELARARTETPTSVGVLLFIFACFAN